MSNESNDKVSAVQRLFNECDQENPNLNKIDEYINECRCKNEDMNTLLQDHRLSNDMLIYMTSLHVACLFAYHEIVERLLDSMNNFKYSVDVNMFNSLQMTALQYACCRSCPLTARTLPQHPNIEVNKVNHIYSTPLHYAVNHRLKANVSALLRHPDIKLLEKDRNGRIPLHHACIHIKNDTDIIQMLIGHQQQKHRIVQLNSIDNVHRTPLHTACNCHNNVAVVEILKHVAVIDINATDIDGQTPLHVASLCEWSDLNSTTISIIKNLLEQSSIMIHIENNDGKTPLDIIKQHLDKPHDPRFEDIKPYFREVLQLFDNFHVQRRWQIYCYLNKFDIDIVMTR